MCSTVIFNCGIAHFIKNIIFNRQSHCEIVRINTFYPSFGFTNVVEIISPNDGPSLLWCLACVHIDGPEVGEHFTYIINVVVRHKMIIAKDQNARMRRIVNFVVRHTVADPRQNDAWIIRLVIISKIVNMRIFHIVVARLQRDTAASVQRDRGPPDVMDVTARYSMIHPRCCRKIIV
ncbi:hypothetical protein D3C85_926380 [compost metagenome]